MEAKKKAEELVKKFACGGWGLEHAVICVEEILNVISTRNSLYLVDEIGASDYWKQVKIEIEKLP